jgi:selenocysteine lyase/cysteine desulfurase
LTVALAASRAEARTPPPRSIAQDDDAWFESWRACELARLDRQGLTYVDYTGAPPFPVSLLEADANRLRGAVHGNPHAQSGPSLNSTGDLAATRSAILAFLNADPADYTVILTANASAACRLVGESYPFTPGGEFASIADNHNSVNGIREFARSRGATVRVLPLDDELRIAGDAIAALEATVGVGQPRRASLFALPAQSNFSGVRHPLGLVAAARRAGWRVLLDAAALLPTADLDLRVVQPDFLCLSIYKISGFPTGIGALVARHEALAELVRPSFAGGTVRWVSLARDRHLMAEGPDRFEDGTPNFLAAGAIPHALGSLRAAGRSRLGRHLDALSAELLDGFREMRHRNGRSRLRIHGPLTTLDRGATVAFSVLRSDGSPVPFWEVEEAAREARIALRGGCFCNPGCSEHAFALADASMTDCLDTLGDRFTIPAFASCVGDRAVGAIRVSLGLGTVRRDVDRVLAFFDGRFA